MRRLVAALAILLGVVVVATIGYMVLEEWPALDALYMTVITVSTVGFREIHPMSRQGTIWTIFVVVGGGSGATLLVAALARWIVEGEFQRLIRRQKVEKVIEKMKDHFVLCGCGRVGQEVARQFYQTKTPFVVVELSEENTKKLPDEEISVVFGDATDEAVLRQAGLPRARGIVTTLQDDAANVYVCLTARSLCPGIRIVARASDQRAINNMRQAGADRILSPNILAGHQLAQACLRPAVLDFVHIATGRRALELDLEEMRLSRSSPYTGKNLADTDIRSSYNVIVVAIRRGDSSMIFNPSSTQVLEEGDTLVLLGSTASLEKLESRLR